MKVFISWSGTRSKDFAVKLAEWIPDIIQSVRPFVSVDDIDKGARWANVIAKELEQARFGIICVTEDTIRAPWLNFEAGALSRRFSSDAETPVATLILDMSSPNLPQPLGQFNATLATKDDVFRLVKSINAAAGADAVEAGRLERLYEMMWPQLETSIGLVGRRPDTKKPQSLPDFGEKLDEMLSILRTMERNRTYIPVRTSLERLLDSSAATIEDAQISDPGPNAMPVRRVVSELMGWPSSKVTVSFPEGTNHCLIWTAEPLARRQKAGIALALDKLYPRTTFEFRVDPNGPLSQRGKMWVEKFLEASEENESAQTQVDSKEEPEAD